MKRAIYIVLGILVLVILGLGYYAFDQHSQMEEMVEQMTIEKEELQEEYEELAFQFDGYQQMDIRNDSLQDLLGREQQRVQDLLEELRQTKASNARRIGELKKELATVRAIMKDYVRQIDSLNATNQRLTVENEQLAHNNAQLTQSNEHLSSENSKLTETVTRASMLEVTSCTLTTLNKNDRKTRIASHIRKLQFDYTIAKNITCTPGIKHLYTRVIAPDGTLLGYTEPTEGEAPTQVFSFESGEVPYSMVQEIEYTGEPYNGTCYCAIVEKEEVQKGFYTIEFFCEGNMIGSFPFQIKK